MPRRYSWLLVLALLPLAFSCEKKEDGPACSTPATIRNLTGFDGCGYVLVLSDGKRLEPHGEVWDGFPKKDGATVTIGYVDEPMASICMVGSSVRLTCIQ